MPRKARLDIPGLLQHVIVRGIERKKIFFDDTDRRLFVARLSTLLEETDTDCFAWALIPNHFHLLLRPNRIELKQFMSRLLTGYAVNFNHRHSRAGHLFQNRYKSIVCEEDSYLLELVRYIHLNPLRAKLVSDLAGLHRYPWSGHAVLMGKQEMAGQAIKEVYYHFGKSMQKGRQGYLEFVSDGVGQGKRQDLVGGGLKRSQGAQAVGAIEPESFDERVLGSGEFVDGLRSQQRLREKMLPGILLPELLLRVARYYGLDSAVLRRRSKDLAVTTARDVFCCLAVRELRHSGTEVGGMLGIRRAAVSHAVRRGERRVQEVEGGVELLLQKLD